MKLWILRPIHKKNDAWEPWYDKSFGFVVRAESEEWARAHASCHHGDEGAEAWTDPAQSTCVELTKDGDEGVVMNDFASA